MLSNLLRLEKLDNYLQEWRVPEGSFWRDVRAHAQVVRSDHRLFRVAVSPTICMVRRACVRASSYPRKQRMIARAVVWGHKSTILRSVRMLRILIHLPGTFAKTKKATNILRPAIDAIF